MSEDQGERLEDVARECAGTNQINIGGNTVTAATEHLPAERRLLIRWAFQYARDRRLSWDELARVSDVSTTTWYRVWRGRYLNPTTHQPIDLAPLCVKIEKWKRLADQRAHIREEMFVETSVWKRISWLCERALVRRKMGFIFSASHVGKSICLEEFARRNNSGQTTLVEVPPAAGVQLLTRTIARALHVPADTCYEKLIEDVLAAVDDSKLLIIDEVHRVFSTYQKGSVMRCLEVLRYIHDRRHCGMVLCGTDAFRDQLQEGQFAKYLLQLRRRGLYEIEIPEMPPRADLDLIARQYGLPPATGEAEDIMLHLVKANAVAIYFTRLDDAVEMAGKKGEDLSWDHFVRACSIVARMRKST
jgi:DNA transposition AAA+ family ATPase